MRLEPMIFRMLYTEKFQRSLWAAFTEEKLADIFKTWHTLCFKDAERDFFVPLNSCGWYVGGGDSPRALDVLEFRFSPPLYFRHIVT